MQRPFDALAERVYFAGLEPPCNGRAVERLRDHGTAWWGLVVGAGAAGDFQSRFQLHNYGQAWFQSLDMVPSNPQV